MSRDVLEENKHGAFSILCLYTEDSPSLCDTYICPMVSSVQLMCQMWSKNARVSDDGFSFRIVRNENWSCIEIIFILLYPYALDLNVTFNKQKY